MDEAENVRDTTRRTGAWIMEHPRPLPEKNPVVEALDDGLGWRTLLVDAEGHPNTSMPPPAAAAETTPPRRDER